MPLPACTQSYAPLCQALQLVDSYAHPAFVVGGFVRDTILGRQCQDLDITVRGDPVEAARELSRVLGGTFFVMKERHSTARVIVSSPSEARGDSAPETVMTVDFVGFDGDVTSDLTRRDFTVNAIAVPCSAVAAHMTEQGVAPAVIAQHAHDPLGGLDDIARRTLRATSAHAFSDDPGRLMRAVRLTRELGFDMDYGTELLVQENSRLIADVAAERTREELLKLLSLPGAADGIRLLDRLGLLTEVFPELESCRGLEQPTVHFWDVLEHSIQTVATLEFVTGEADWAHGNEEMLSRVPGEDGSRIYFEHMVSREASRGTLTKLACLLHDIAKPQTKTLEDDGRARFLGHSQQGATVARDILQRLRFSSSETDYVETLVYNHLRPYQLSCEGLPSSRAVYRFFRDTKDAGFGTLFVAMADYLACKGPLFTMSEWDAICDLLNYIVAEQQRQQTLTAPARLIDGNDLMRTLDLKPGPRVGMILETIREAHAAGAISTKAEAFKLARRALEEELR